MRTRVDQLGEPSQQAETCSMEIRRILDALIDTPRPVNAISNADELGMGGDTSHDYFSNGVGRANCALGQANWSFCNTTSDETNTHKMH